MIWLWLLIALTFITVLGHGIWALLAFTLRALFNLPEPEIKIACPNCGRQTSPRRGQCQWCGQSRQAAAPTELDDVAAVERQLERWRAGGQLKPSEAARLVERVQAYRQSLAAAVPPGAPPSLAAPQRELARLLGEFADLSPAGQSRALEMYDRMTPDQRAALGLSVQIDLARLLARTGRIGDAIGVYGRILEVHPNHLGKGRIALEATRLALQRHRHTHAARFLALLDQLALPQLEAEKESLARALNAATTAKAPEPVMAEVVEPADRASAPLTPVASDAARLHQSLGEAPPFRGAKGDDTTSRRDAKAKHEQIQPAAPRRSLAEVLSTFMEERNIRWGELVGGLLIVCSSVALVISLWETLKTIPYFQFFIFVGVSAALFGVGLYTEHRWKLASTSRGILIISTLLVPLNFVAMAGTARERWDVPAALTQLAALAIFTTLVQKAGRVLVDGWRTWLTLAVVGGSGMLLTVPHQPGLGWGLILAAPAVALAALAVGRAVVALASRERPTADDANRLFILLGTVLFTVAVALGLIVARSADRPAALNVLSPLIALAGTLVALCGLLIMRAMNDQSQAGLRTTGTAVGLSGAAIMLAAAALAWPLPAAMIAVALFSFAALALLAVRYRLPMLHAVAIACLALAYVTAIHVALGNLPAMERAEPSMSLLRLFASAQTGTSLVGLFLALAIAAELFSRRGRANDALVYVGGCAVVGVASLSLVAVRGYWNGYADAWRAAIVFATYGFGCLALNLRWRRPLATHCGTTLVGIALVYAIAFTGTVHVPYHWLVIALAQATWTIVASVIAGFRRSVAPALVAGPEAETSTHQVPNDHRAGHKARDYLAFAGPLRQSGITASFMAVAAFVGFNWQRPLVLSIDLAWLAALWLVLAITERSPHWFAAFQTAVYVAAAFAITSWLNDQAWVAHDPRSLLHPRSLQVYGIGWGLIGLAWIVLRAAVSARTLLADRLSVDRIVNNALIVASFTMAVGGSLPGIVAEFSGAQLTAVAGLPVAALQAHVFGGLGWVLVGVLAAGAFAAYWNNWGDAELVGTVLLLVNAALLVAGPAAASWATASALRWALAVSFVIGSLAVWLRAALARIAARCKCRIDVGVHASDLAAGLLITLAAAPVVCFSGLVATMRILGNAPAGPLSGIWLADVGLSVSHLVPLSLVVLGLVGYAVREGSPGYAFAAGIVANLTVTGGYALNLPQFGATEAARLVQLATITTSLWAVGWLAGRRRVLWLGGHSESAAAWPLLQLQVAQSALGNLALLLSGFGLLAVASPVGTGAVHHWIATVGSPMGWTTLALACAAGGFSAWLRRRRLRPEIAGLLGMTVLGLAACSVEAMLPDTPWAYRTLMLGWATYAVSVVAATWWATAVYAPAGAEGPPTALVRAAAVWVRVSELLALLLGLKTVAVGGQDMNEPLWGAAAIGIASAAAAAMAVWQRREGWAFTAGLGVNLAASIVVWHRLAIENRHVAGEWIWFVQANLIAAAVVALLWLAARRRMYAGRELSLGRSPFLTLQTGVVAAGNVLLLGFALMELIVEPGSTSDVLAQYGTSAGWFAWLLGSAALALHLCHVARRELVHAVASALLGVGALAAISTGQADVAWQAYHTLIIAWSAVAVGLLAAGWLADRRAGKQIPPAAAWRWLKLLAPAGEIEAWVMTVEMALAALAVRGAAGDPAVPGWPMAAALSASGLAAGLALWRRKPQHVYSCGLLANLAASLFWHAQESGTLGDLLLMNAIALAATGIFWSLISRWTGAIEPREASENFPPFEHAAAAVSVALVAVVAWLAWGSSWLSGELPSTALQFPYHPQLAWVAWTSVVATLAVALWDRRATFCPAGFYAVGIAAVGLALAQHGWIGHELMWATGPALAGWMLVAALLDALMCGFLRHEGSGFRVRGSASLGRWFSVVQTAVAFISTALGVWIALAFETPLDRAAGGVSSILILIASALMTRSAPDQRQLLWQMAVLALAVVAPAEGLWAFCDGFDPAILWIHRGVALLVSLALSVVGCEFFALRFLPATSRWRHSIVRFLPTTIGLALVVLAIVLAQERAQYIPYEGVPMALAAKIAVAAILIGLALLAIMYAVLDRRDLLQLSPRGRTLYVYAAEALAILVCFHVRTTMPKLIPFGIIENWWTLIVMIVAFCGAGLAELFERRRLSVLAEPLIRTAVFAPLLPAAAPLAALVWLPEEQHVWLVEARRFSNEAALFLVAAFYGIQAALTNSASSPLTMREDDLSRSERRQNMLGQSLLFAGLSAASGNAGLWLLWHRLHLEFLVHPQLWLIPPALVVLVAEYLNRNRLTPEQSGAVRYLALATIYVASTADVFISHVDRHISLPLVLVLLGLSIAGVLSGMLLRVRSFLYLGFTFLLVDLSVMVYHAAWDLGHTWVFYGTGIVVGLAILALFGVFEKRRNDVVLALERFKEWR